MSAPGRPKRESFARSDKAGLIIAPGRPKRESFGSDSDNENPADAPGGPGPIVVDRKSATANRFRARVYPTRWTLTPGEQARL